MNLPISFDKDTQERSGSPEIARVIFEKIDRSLIFVADVSFINTEGAKKLPNPNVLVETGYALSSLGDEHGILIFNDATGQKEDLPFDLKSKRITTYSCSDDRPAESKQEEKKKRLYSKTSGNGIIDYGDEKWSRILTRCSQDHCG